ncbi:hypothetical protein BDN71DRAFT_530557 [Pleurotus eryngii]|uniref:Uncharacterized protein n=1 Tax=Pleurotus eryngii TaxID=5323 RepID=A0A9P6A2D5_PLEER|nr:hypothetical protein BDN71DRAFT_530557 [Pleurotus eryngii]
MLPNWKKLCSLGSRCEPSGPMGPFDLNPLQNARVIYGGLCGYLFYEPNWDQKTLRNYPPARCIVTHFRHAFDTLAGRECNLAVDTRRQPRTFSAIYPYTIRRASWLCGLTYVFCLRGVATCSRHDVENIMSAALQRQKLNSSQALVLVLTGSSWSRAVCRATLTRHFHPTA